MTSYLQRLHFGTFANNPRTRSAANTHTRKVFVVLRTFYKTEVSNRLTSVHSLSVCTSGCLSIALGHHTRLVCHSYHRPRSAPNREQISKKIMLIKSQLISILYHRHGYVAYATTVIDDIQNIATATYYDNSIPHPKTKVNSFSKIIAKLLKKHTTIYSLRPKKLTFVLFFSLF